MKNGIAPRTAQISADKSVIAVKVDTPQQDSDWSEDRKIEWVKGATRKLVKAFDPAASDD